jgi:prevent-host-death family protein
MNVATSGVRVEVGVRELKNGLSRYLERVAGGTEIVITDRGRPVARLVHIDASTQKLADLIASGAVRAASSQVRQRPARRIAASGSVSELVAEQRR